jgi:transglutaminase/protease-like cytokinesis protein 3
MIFLLFAENVIFEGHGVCDGYATAFKILCNAAGIECVIPRGFSKTGGHAWNQAKIDGKWYNFDVCWGDTMYSNRISYDFFGKSDNVFAKDGHQVYKLNVSKYECNENLFY